ncbi:MAG: hypothetical protein QM756_38615 [Polyangiaceae bacterium]
MPLIRDDDGAWLEIRGRGALCYFSPEGKGYEVNSEMVASDEYDIAVYASDVVLAGTRTQLTGVERGEVISRVRKLCEKGRVRIRVFE